MSPLQFVKTCKPAALALLLPLGACVTDGPVTTEAACHVFKPISSSVRDTHQTRVEVFAHNAVGARLCDWTPSQ